MFRRMLPILLVSLLFGLVGACSGSAKDDGHRREVTAGVKRYLTGHIDGWLVRQPGAAGRRCPPRPIAAGTRRPTRRRCRR